MKMTQNNLQTPINRIDSIIATFSLIFFITSIVFFVETFIQ